MKASDIAFICAVIFMANGLSAATSLGAVSFVIGIAFVFISHSAWKDEKDTP